MAKAKQISMPELRSVRGAELSRARGLSHLSWTFDRESSRQLTGDVTSRGVGPLHTSWIKLSLGQREWGGKRTTANIQSNPEPYLIIVMPIYGSI